MCLAIPGKVIEKSGVNLATVEMMGVTRQVSLDMVGDAEIGDWVLVHAGFAIDKVDEQFANETIELMKQIPGLYDEDPTLMMTERPITFDGK